MTQTARDSRWITVRQPFNYVWASRAQTYFSEPGEFLVKNEVADFAVEKGYASEGKVDGSAKSKPRRKTSRKAAPKKEAVPAKTPDTRSDASVAEPAVVAADSAGDRGAVDQAAG